MVSYDLHYCNKIHKIQLLYTEYPGYRSQSNEFKKERVIKSVMSAKDLMWWRPIPDQVALF